MGKRKLEAETTVYQQFISIMMRSKRRMFEICEARQLTPVQGMLLICMKPDEAQTMHELAKMMGCDASNITGLVDRLEAAGLIARTADMQDRRVKKIRLCDKGEERRTEILEQLREAEVLDLKQLSSEEYNELRRVLFKLEPVS